MSGYAGISSAIFSFQGAVILPFRECISFFVFFFDVQFTVDVSEQIDRIRANESVTKSYNPQT